MSYIIASLVLFLTCSCGGFCGKYSKVPDFIKVCAKNSPNFTDCAIESAENLKPALIKGLPEFNIPSLEPFVLDELIREDSLGLQITADNVKVFGTSNFQVTKLKVDFKTHRFDFDVFLPKLNIEAKYGVDGKILFISIKGSGPMIANVTNCVGQVVLQGQTYENDGEKHLRFNTMTIKVKVGGGRGRLDNLFNGDRIVGNIINEVINRNFDIFLNELMPVIERSLSSVFLDIANNIVEPFSYDQLFPDK